MRKLLVSVMILSVGLFWGCGGDDGGTGDDGSTTPRLLVNTTVATPTMSSPNETMWNSVDSVMVSVSAANTPKVVPGAKIASLASEIKVQAIAKNDTLYVRLRWADNSMNAWPDYWYVTDTFPVVFGRNEIEYEDQAYLMFDGAPGGGYDVWGWKVSRTGGLGMGMGYRYRNDSLILDAAGDTPTPLEIVTDNKNSQFPTPLRISEEGSAFTDYAIFLSHAVDFTNEVRDTTHGWTMGQKLPGYLIDSSIVAPWRTDANRGSRLDVRSADGYAGGGYSLVMMRKMNTGFGDDLNLAALDSVRVVVALFDNQNTFTTGGTHRGFSVPFWLVF